MEVNNKVITKLARVANDSAIQFSAVFRQTSSNLIVASGILLAFSAQALASIDRSQYRLKVIAVLMIISLVVSLAFGVLSSVLEARYFWKNSVRRMKILNDLLAGEPQSEKKVAKVSKDENEIRLAVNVWPVLIQLLFLAVYFGLVITLSIEYLYIY